MERTATFVRGTAASTSSVLLSYLNELAAATGKATLFVTGASKGMPVHYIENANNVAVIGAITAFLSQGIAKIRAGDRKSIAILAVSGSVLYVTLCNTLRFRRQNAMHKKFNYTSREAMAKMTNDEAHEIITYMAELEFPKIFLTSVEFALFKTYGIPTISSLLCATGEFYNPKTSSKRLADTSVLIGEFTSHAPASERSIKAIARMNYIHSPYQKAGKITQDDLLYTLSVFMTEPVRWVGKYEWRSLTPMEVCAIGTFWKSIGDGMGIEYKGRLKGAETGWKDGFEFWEDVEQWALAYEEKCMVPAESNKKTGDETAAMLLHLVPMRLRPIGMKAVAVMMDDRLRRSMMYPDPPKSYTNTIMTILYIRRFILRYLSLPRPSFMAVSDFSKTADESGRYHYNYYKVDPYYNEVTFWSRWGPIAWMTRAFGGAVPGDNGDAYCPQGYKFEDIGPKRTIGKGKDVTDAIEAKLREERPAGCPFRR